MFKIHKEELEVNGKKLTLETGKVARQADGAIIASLGETVVIATCCWCKKIKRWTRFFSAFGKLSRKVLCSRKNSRWLF
jgi:polyribonucleotide nucleotidyltransferase